MTSIGHTGRQVKKNVVARLMRSSIKNNLKDYFLTGSLIDLHEHMVAIIRGRKPAYRAEEVNKP